MSNFNELINSGKPVLVDFYADWCGPCKMMQPVLQELKSSIGDRATIVKINVDRNPEAAAAFGIQGVPTLILFRNGAVQWRQSGVVPARQLEAVIEKYS